MGRRIVTTTATAKGGINERGIRGTAAPTDDYSSRLVKYIPAEIITAFVTMNGSIVGQRMVAMGSFWGIAYLNTFVYTLFNPRTGYASCQKANCGFVGVVFALGVCHWGSVCFNYLVRPYLWLVAIATLYFCSAYVRPKRRTALY